ncbi:pro-sigmaK processing inhibitor BofA family protein [Paenibacillus yanchengensis]|uniref:Pro-sigmaK processing inhibitor BofA family protein n=1 Tax=Paenibacillus yanchengensis TaxID=2035833 RepID=A0ABW4YP70_9BACL
MKLIWTILLVASLVALLFLWIKHKLSWSWFWKLSLQVVVAAVAIYIINVWQVIPQITIPINPVTIVTLVVLGIPGAMLLAGLQLFIV